MNDTDPATTDFRVDALASFSHEVRTPLTAIRMVLDLAGRSDDGGRHLDGELAGLLETSLAELNQLVEDFQAFSRAERGRESLARVRRPVRDLVAAANDTRSETRIELADDGGATVEVDAQRAPSLLAALATGVDRMGDGAGSVTLTATAAAAGVTLELSSGIPADGPHGGVPYPQFSYFAALALFAAMGANAGATRGPRYCRLELTFPPAP